MLKERKGENKAGMKKGKKCVKKTTQKVRMNDGNLKKKL